MTSEGVAQFPRVRIGVLGLITIAAYGSWYYSFGVLLDPIISDTGWSEPALAGAFSVSAVVSGLGAVGGGWLLDRMGSRFVFGTAAMISLASFGVASTTESIFVFTIASAIGGGTIGSLGFYHVTQTVAVRITPRDTTKAIAVLTIWGAFASAIYLPIAAWLVQANGWRLTLQILVGSAVAILAIGAVAIHTKTAEMPRSAQVFQELASGLRTPAARRFIAAQGLVGIAVAVLLVYQVPAMTAAGLSLGAASFWAGFRGFSQLGGRLPLMAIVRRIGAARALKVSYVAIAVGLVLLTLAGNHWVAAIFAVVAGFGIGASSPLVGMYSRDVFGEKSLGTAMGSMSMVFLVVGAPGPALAGWVATSTGSRALPVLASAVLSLGAAFLIGPARNRK